jgi:class 3 adenylate cyclase/tetratricopeptide (TPR) repeat protein
MIKCPGCGDENPLTFRFCSACGTSLARAATASLPPREVRTTVTIVFSDLKGSTTLGEQIDSEALHEVKERYFSAMAAEITRHGGKVEKYIGDAIMAVFGLPRAHEDDALRAVRAAAGMQVALAKVNQDLIKRYGVALSNRTGINTGEVVANADPNAIQKLATGDAVNVAARLEQAAPENQIYIGDVTFLLVRDAVTVEPVEPLELKGKAERVSAYRLVSVSGIEGNARRIDTPIVGRDVELAALAAAYREACESRTARLVSVIGDAGVGKSRLVHELVERIATGARVLRGRCLPYGDGITFWPLVSMVAQAADIRDADSPDDACIKLLAVVGQPDVTERLASATGFTTATFPLGEINWATRKFFETLAAEAPLVVVVDDIHWAENAFLELLEHVRDAAVDATILLLATARHDLVEAHPDWGTRPNETKLVLGPLGDAASAQIVANVLGSADLPGAVVARIVAAAEGNPLYVEQMLSMLIDSGALHMENGRWVGADGKAEIPVSPTIHALLEARLEQLGRDVRATVEPASVIGLEFAQPAVESLLPDALRAVAGKHLATLTHMRFIRPAVSTDPDFVYRFNHHLVRDTVYRGLLKRARATLHVEFVHWADRVNAVRDRALEIEEVLGYHLEQAHHYLSELGPLDEEGMAIGRDAAKRLSNAAKRALARGDMHAAANLLQRATGLLPNDDPQRVELLPAFGQTLMSLGEFAQARTVLAEARTAADRISNDRIKASSQIVEMFVHLLSGRPGAWSEVALTTAHGVVPVLERESAHHELALTWRLIVLAHGIAGRYTLASEAAERSTAHARLAGDELLVAKNSVILAINALYGSTPVPQGIVQCERLIAGGLSDRQTESSIMCTLAQLKAMNGELEAARGLYRRGRATLRDLGQGVFAASTGLDLARVELHGGDLAIAEREVRTDYEFLARTGETYFLSTMAALLSRIVRDQGRDDEALTLSQIAEGATAVDDIESQALWRSIRAPIVARDGNIALAEELARTALEFVRRTEAHLLQADALTELATVLRIAGKPDQASRVIREAIALYSSKGDVLSAARWTSWTGELDRR